MPCAGECTVTSYNIGPNSPTKACAEHSHRDRELEHSSSSGDENGVDSDGENGKGPFPFVDKSKLLFSSNNSMKSQNIQLRSLPKDEDIVIAGLSGRYPDCDNIYEFWEKLLNGVELSSTDDRRWPVGYLSLPPRTGKIRDISKCDYEFFGFSESEANFMDVQMRIALETTYESIVDAGLDPKDLRGSRTSLFAGICYDDTGTAYCLSEETAQYYQRISLQKVASAFDFRGGTFSADTACASSFTAFYQAYYSIRSGLCDQAIVLGVAVSLRPQIALGFSNLRMCSSDGRSKCMDTSADGYGRSEAVVSILLQRKSNAKRNYATVVTTNINTDGFKTEGITFPSIDSQHRLMKSTHELANIPPESMKYIEAHMTGTPAGDVVESESIRRTFCDSRSEPLKIGCLKSNLGHTEGASGTCALTKVCLVFEHQELPPNINFKTPNPNIKGLESGILDPVLKRQPFHEKVIGCSSFGFGGCNVYSILRANEKEPSPDSYKNAFGLSMPRLVVACGRTDESVHHVFDYIDENRSKVTNEFFGLLSDVMTRRKLTKSFVPLDSAALPYRAFSIYSTDGGQLIKKESTRVKFLEPQPIWLAISGISNKWPTLSKSLLRFDAFDRSLRRSSAITREKVGIDLFDLLFSPKKDIKLSEAMIGVTATQIALIDLIADLDITIDGFIGHSIGEIVCAYADGCLSREQSIMTSYLIAKHLMNASIKNGSTGLIEWDEIGVHTEKVKSLYPSIYDSLSKVVFNGSNKRRRRTGRWVSTTSSSTGSGIDDNCLSASYFARGITSPNNFRNMLYLLPKNAVVIEVTPQPILEGTLRRGLGPDVTILSMVNPRSSDPIEHLLSTLGSIYLSGSHVNIGKLYPKVEYPVPRGTLSISPIIKWNHKKSLTVTTYPEYFTVIKEVTTYEIDLMQSSFQYLSGHIIDGRNLCPAVEYLRFIWNVVIANLYGARDYMRYPIEFRKVRFVRGIMLSKSKSVDITSKYSRETGQFEITEGGNLCCTGYAFVATDPSTDNLEKLVQPKSNDETVVTLDNKSIYKELRVRGYDYGPTFQGLIEANSDGSRGRVKWMGQWVSFVDSMLQIAILSSNERVLRIPTYIEYVKCNSSIFMENIESSKDEMGESIVDVKFDKTAGVGASKGIVIMGLRTTEIARRNTQKPVLESYHFSPYIESVVDLGETIDRRLTNYERDCRSLMDVITTMTVSDGQVDEAPTRQLIQSLEKKYSNSPTHSILYSLIESVKELIDGNEQGHERNNVGKSPQQVLNEKMMTNKDKIALDMFYVTPLESENMTRHSIDIIIENSITRDMKILELNTSNCLFAEKVTDLMSLNLMNPNYTVMHSEPSAILVNKSGVANFVDWSKRSDKHSIPNDLTDIDVIIFRDDKVLTSMKEPEPEPVNVKEMIPEISKSLKPSGFLLMFIKSKQSSFERELLLKSDFSGADALYATPEEIVQIAKEHGLEVVSMKSEPLTNVSSMLFRKSLNLDELMIKTIRITNENYDWINEVKATLVPEVDNKDDKKTEKKKSEHLKNVRLWLTSNESSSGLIGLVNCLRREPGFADVVRCYLNPNAKDPLDVPQDILRKDLSINVYQNGSLGSFRHSILEKTEVVQPSNDAYVDIKTKGDMSSFRWIENNTKYHDANLEKCKITRDEQLIKVSYASLNFKDVMIASGRISSDAYPAGMGISGSLLGMEFSGLDENGNRVMGYTLGKGMATKVSVLHPMFLWPVPKEWSLEQAATIPIVYATVYYGLIIRGRLRRGESVLIHSGAGGVGQAAINVCQSMGCTIFTTCSDGKRDFLKKTFGLEDWQIANSRDTSFEEHILRESDGRGVDIVLNSLSESKLKASINCLADFGRFVEIGKYDILTNNLMDLSQFGTNKAFQTVCLAHLDVDAFVNRNPSALSIRSEIYDMMCDGLRQGVVKPLQTHVYDKEHVEDAFRFMASGKHVGKVLIRVANEEEIHVKETTIPTTVQQTLFHPQKSYIITGGLGGFGLELTQWMVARGAKKFVLTSRVGIKDNYQKVFLHRLNEESIGVHVTISTQDITTVEGSKAVIEEATKMGPVGGIFNLAMVLKDATLENQNVDSFVACCGPKVAGTLHLDNFSRSLCPELDYFVCFSSVVSGRGNAGQTNYGFANSVMERLCENRRRLGLHGLAIQWGAIGDVGVVAEVLGGNDVIIGGTSVPQRIPSCLETLDQFLMSNEAVVSSIVRVNLKKVSGVGKGDLLGTVCHILGIKDPSSLDPNSTLSELGMDSLMAIEIKQGLEREYDIVLTTQEIRNMKISNLKEMEAMIKEKGLGQNGSGRRNAGCTISDKVTVESIITLPKGNFVLLNDNEAGKPIFCFPPIEGSFRQLTPLARHVNRPVIGVNWTEDVDKMTSLKDIVAYYVHLIKQNYPDSTYDVLGYDFGGLIAIELAAQLHNKFGDQSCTKIGLIESSPDLMKSYATDLLTRHKNHPKQNEVDPMFNTLLIEYYSMFFPIESSDRSSLESDLEKFGLNRDDKLKFMAEMFDRSLRDEDKKRSEDKAAKKSESESESEVAACDPTLLGVAIDRLYKKLHFAANFEPSRSKIKAMFGLQRSAGSIESMSQSSIQLDSSYNLSKIQHDGEDFALDVLEGHHRSFLMFHDQMIGHSLDSFFVNVSCA